MGNFTHITENEYSWEKIGKRIKSERARYNLSQKELMVKIGRAEESYRVLGCWEKGTARPQFSDMIELCKVFDCDIGYLLCEPRYGESKSIEIASACEVTGLSDKDITILSRWSKEKDINRKIKKAAHTKEAVLAKTKILSLLIEQAEDAHGESLIDTLYLLLCTRIYAPLGWNIDDIDEATQKWACEFYEKEGRAPTEDDFIADNVPCFQWDSLTRYIPVILEDYNGKRTSHLRGEDIKQMYLALVTKAIFALEKIAEQEATNGNN